MEHMHKSGFVNIVGNPNVGKSTLINAFLGEKIAIVTHKAQTTRHRILGIVNGPDYQVVFSDTPGIINPAYKLQTVMMHSVKEAFDDADLLLIIVEVGQTSFKDPEAIERINKCASSKMLLVNKIDLSDQEALEASVSFWSTQLSNTEIIPISALTGFNVKALFEKICTYIPEAPPYFPKDQITDRSERFIVSEKVREKILLYYKKEVPYAVEVVTESFEEEEKIIKIRSIIIVERNSQKSIVIGHRGNALKKVGTQARKSLEAFFGKKIFLDLYVKVDKDWRSNDGKLKHFGYKM